MAAQSSLDLSNPFNRLATLPQAVNWRGAWSPAIVYFRNDIVISPLNFGSYINIFPGTTIRGGGDPSTNPVSWYAFGAGAAGVQEIQGSQYIDVSQSTTPTISNKGVLNAILLPGIDNLSTNLNPILEDLGLTSIIPDTGIAWDSATKKLSNTGVTQIIGNVGPGISVTGTTTVSLACTGVISIFAAPNSGLSVTPGPTPLISNTGLLGMGVGTGLLNQGDALEPYVFNNGLIDLATVDNSLLLNNFPDLTLATVNPSISLICTQSQTSNMAPNPLQGGTVGQPPPTGLIPVTQIAGTRWATSIATQSPYSTGTFTINVSLAYSLQANTTSPSFDAGNTLFTIYDSVNNVSYQPSVNINQIQHNRNLPTNASPAFYIMMLRVVVDLTELWNQGFRIMTHFKLQQIAVLDPSKVFISLRSMNSNFYAVYNSQVLNLI